jgi:hypothetical protein
MKGHLHTTFESESRRHHLLNLSHNILGSPLKVLDYYSAFFLFLNHTTPPRHMLQVTDENSRFAGHAQRAHLHFFD